MSVYATTHTRDRIGLQFFAAAPSDRLTQIETRLAQIGTDANQDGADLAALNQEADQLIEERKQLMEAAETRTTLLSKIGGGDLGTPVPQFTAPLADPEQRAAASFSADSAEYRSAWLKHLRNNDMTTIEQRAFTTVANSAGAVVPTETANSIVAKVNQYAPLLGKINLLHVPGMVKFAVEKTVNKAQYHAQNAKVNPSDDALAEITLSGFEITKMVQISKSVMQMSVSAFETWLVDRLARSIAELVSETILTGTGSSQGTGIEKAATWGETNSVEVASAAALTPQDVLALIALLPGSYDARAEFVMSKKTLFTDFMPLQDKKKNDIVTVQGNAYYIYGYPVTLDERVPLHEAYLADLYTVIGNMPEDITITSGFDLDTNSYKFLGCAMFDCKPSMPDAIVKLRKAAGVGG